MLIEAWSIRAYRTPTLSAALKLTSVQPRVQPDGPVAFTVGSVLSETYTVADRMVAHARGFPPPTLQRFNAQAVRRETVVLPSSGATPRLGAAERQPTPGELNPKPTGAESAWISAM
jgi:hypothetical protein